MSHHKRNWSGKIILGVCIVSIVFSLVLVRYYTIQENRIRYAESQSMVLVAIEMGNASDSLQDHRQYAVAMLAEVAGTLKAVQSMEYRSSNEVSLVWIMSHFIYTLRLPPLHSMEYPSIYMMRVRC